MTHMGGSSQSVEKILVKEGPAECIAFSLGFRVQGPLGIRFFQLEIEAQNGNLGSRV